MESKKLFLNGLNCAQSVFVPYAVKFFPDPKMAYKVMSPFGGGIAHTDNICGAVTGGIAAIGLHIGHTSGTEAAEKAHCAEVTRKFLSEFKKLHGSINCSDLLGHNMSKPGEMEKAREEGKFKSICAMLVESSSQLVDRILKEESSK